MKKYHHCVKFTYPLSFQTRIPKVDQHTGGKWLIHGTKHRKDNQLQSLNSSLYVITESFGVAFLVHALVAPVSMTYINRFQQIGKSDERRGTPTS